MKVSRTASGGPEIFHSIQGEGASTGKPAVFVRLAGCNLSCTWCDTRYTWDWSHFDPQQEVADMEVGEVARVVLKLNCPRVVITGGEPLLQQDELASLLGQLKGRAVIEIETNGTILPENLAGRVDQWNVSPKLASSGNKADLREKERCYAFFRDQPSSFFKFAVDGEDDIAEVDLVVDRYGIREDRVILMPVACTVSELLERSPSVAEACQSRGYSFSTRMHILLWGGRRGV